MRTICERMRAVQGQPVSGQREEEKEKSHKGYRYSSSGYSPAVSPLSMQSLPMQKMQVQSLGREGPLEKEMAIYSRRRHLPPSVMGWGGGGCGDDFTADPLGAVEPCLNLEVLAQAGRTKQDQP